MDPTVRGRGAARKRRATAAAAPAAAPEADEQAPQLPLASRKKPRRRDDVQSRESEFVSVEVGMRELRKRLATDGDRASAVAKGARRTSTRGTKGEASDAVEPPVSSLASRRGRAATTRTTTTSAADNSGNPARGTRAVPRKGTTNKSPSAVSAGKKLTLAEARVQAQRDREARVESRVQQLKGGDKSGADVVLNPSSGAVDNASPEVYSGTAMAVAAASADPTASAAVSPHRDNQVRRAEAPDALSSDGALNIPQATEGSDAKTVNQSPAIQREPPTPVVANEFIGDDMDEDSIFLLALEQVESKLAASAKPDGSAATAASIKQELGRAPEQCAVEEAMPSVQQVQPEPAVSSIMSPDVLREFERLKRENEELRKSNERLQAVASVRVSPAPSDCATAASAIASSDASPCISAAPTRADASPQTQRVLDLGNGEVGVEEDSDDGDRVSSGQHGSEQAHSMSASPTQYGQSSFQARQSPDASVESPAGATADTSAVSILDLSPAPTLPPKREPVPTSTSMTEGKSDASSGIDDQGLDVDHDMSTRHLASLEHAESDSGRSSSASQASSQDADPSDSVHASSEDEEEEEKSYGARGVAIDCGNYSEYKQERHEEEEKEEDVQDGHDESSTTAVEGAHVRDAHAVKVADVQAPPRRIGDGLELTVPSGNSTNSAIGVDEEEAVTSLPSEPMSSAEVDEDDELLAPTKRSSRPAVIESSSSSESDASHDSETEAMDSSRGAAGSGEAKNALEAALQAAASTTSIKKKFTPHAPAVRPVTAASTVVAARSVTVTKAKPSQKRPAPGTALAAKLGATQAGAKKRARSDSTSLASNATATSKTKSATSTATSARSSLLWPALDDFYDFLLDLSPKHVGGGGGQRQDWNAASSSSLHRFAGRKLPARYDSVEQYCTTQLDAITEELLASIGNSRGWGAGHGKAFYLTSVSQSTPSLSASAQIFSESGFTGAARNANDFILTFRPLPRQRGQGDGSGRFSGGALDLVSGDLISLRAPEWKSFELFVYGVVLCNSIMGDTSGGGSNGSSVSGGGDGSDQVCVLVRVQPHQRTGGVGASDEEALLASFSVVTELCLSNPRASKWSWSIQHVHNTTTSAREYQAVKSVAFLSPELRQTLVAGVLPTTSGKAEEREDDRAEDVLSPALRTQLERQYNAPQMRAIVGCLGEDKTVMIQGPPGTGKTKTVLGLLSALLDGAGLSTLSKGAARIRVGASLQGSGGGTRSGSGPRNNSVRVLVAAPSNAAVDELVVRVVSEGLVDGATGRPYRPRMVRVGRPESVGGSHARAIAGGEREASAAKKTRGKMRKYAAEVEELLLETQVARQKASFGSVRAARQAIVRGAQLVFCTLSGAGSVALCDFAHAFDALVVDEAAQAVEASALIPLKFRPHRTILVGDHRQLPATVLSKRLVAIGYDRSLFQRLVESGSRVRLLTRQYRMHPDIARFPSAFFYGGQLVQDAQLARATARPFHARDPFRPLAFIDVAGGAQSQVRGSTSLRNLGEAELVVLLVRALLRQFPALEWRKAIGVIAPYKQQIVELGARLAQLERELDVPLGVEVNTVDGFQGREKDVIIYSCVRTSAGGRRGPRGSNSKRSGKKTKRTASDDAGAADAFWADERRMNVAITRARASLWILGNSRLLEQSAAWRALLQDARGRRAYFSEEKARKLLLPASTSGRDA